MASVLALLLVANIGFGLAFSSATAARIVRVYGARPLDQARIKKELQFLGGVPSLRLNRSRAEAKLMFIPAMRQAVLNRNIFGRADVRLVYHRPIARLRGTRNGYLSDTGILFTQPENDLELPTLRLAPMPKPGLSVMQAWPLGRLVPVAEEVVRRDLLKKAEIELTSGGSVWLNLDTGTRVELGDTTMLAEKFGAFDSLIRSNPNLLSEASELILKSPSHPAFKKKLR